MQNSPRSAMPEAPLLIDWAITSKCNLDCRHCRGMAENDLSPERAWSLVEEIAGLNPGWVIIEGGEPLLRPDLAGIMEAMAGKGLKIHLITNGMYYSTSLAELFKSLGIKIMVSIDGATRTTYEKIRRGADFEQVLTTARLYAGQGLLEAINFTVLKENRHEIEGIFAVAESLGTRITFIGLKPCHYYPEELLDPGEYTATIKTTCQAARQTGVQFFFDEPFFKPALKEWGISVPEPEGDAGIIFPSTSACIFGRYLFVEPSGAVKPCSFASMTIGSVSKTSLGRIWREAYESHFFKSMSDPASRKGHCRDCGHLYECLGCRSRAQALTGDWFAADPACPLRGGE